MSTAMTITYQRNVTNIDWPTLATIIHDAGLGQPTVDDVQRAYTNSTLVIFAFDHNQLIGAARAISDGVYHAQICDMVVTPSRQRQGIGRAMAEQILHDLTGIKVLLTASFGKENFYRKLGFRRHKTALAYNYGPWWYEDEPHSGQADGSIGPCVR